ncbi:MAG: DUF1993 domain-containing protein [Pseudoxanthomonas sp.]
MSDTLSMYQATVPVAQRALRNLRQLLVKGEAHAQAQGFDAGVLLQTRLYPDMLPLLRQVQIATDGAKNAAARLAGVEALKFDDDETTFAELYARLDRAIDYLGTFTAEQIDGSEGRAISVPRRNGEPLGFDGRTYLLAFVTPNLYFHVATAYAILRHAGVPLGKADFLAGS